MANHKKRKPPNARAGCKMCKPWKISGMSEKKTLTHGEQLQLLKEKDDYEDDFEDVQRILDDDAGDFEQPPGNYDPTATATAPPDHIQGVLRSVAPGIAGYSLITIEEVNGARNKVLCGVPESLLLTLLGKDIKAYFSLNWIINYVTCYEPFKID